MLGLRTEVHRHFEPGRGDFVGRAVPGGFHRKASKLCGGFSRYRTKGTRLTQVYESTSQNLPSDEQT